MYKRKNLAFFTVILLLANSGFVLAGKEKAPELKLKLIWKLRFDSLPANEESIFGRPPEITPEMIPRMIETEDKLIFFDEEGKITKTFDIDRKRFDRVSFSKDKNYVALKKTVGEIPETEIPIPAKVQVFDKEGILKYELDGEESNIYSISNLGYCLEVNYMNNSFTLFDETGKEICHKQLFGNPGIGYENRFDGKFSGDGNKILIYATNYYSKSNEPLNNPEVFIILFDNLGNEITRKRIENANEATGNFDISDNGDYIFIETEKITEIHPEYGSLSQWDGVLLDKNGNALIEPFIFPVAGAPIMKYDSTTNSFISIGGLETIVIVETFGKVSKVSLPDFDIEDNIISLKYIAVVGRKKEGNNVILKIYDKEENLLLDRNLGGNKKDLKKLDINFVNDNILSVKFSNEVRFYRIIELEK